MQFTEEDMINVVSGRNEGRRSKRMVCWALCSMTPTILTFVLWQCMYGVYLAYTLFVVISIPFVVIHIKDIRQDKYVARNMLRRMNIETKIWLNHDD